MQTFWQQALSQAAGGLILAAVAGVGFLVYSVPRQLDQVLTNQQNNQKIWTERFGAIEGRVNKAEQRIDGLDNRMIRIEAQ